MGAKKRFIRYPEERALEDVAYKHGQTPVLILPCLLPVWSVEVEATVTDGEPYGLIDRYLELGIAEGGLDTPDALARFFSLDDVLVDRVLRVLASIGHVIRDPAGRLALTRLGYDSVRDEVRYVEKRQDRRRLYFDAFGSRPLTRPYYDPSIVTLLAGHEVADMLEQRDGPAFRMPFSVRTFRDAALPALANLTDRDRFNLPDRIEALRRVGDEECVFLSMYVVRTAEGGLLAYTQAADTADEDITAICEESPEIIGVLDAEEADARAGRDERRLHEWLRKRDLKESTVVRLRDGMLRVVLPRSAFSDTGKRSLPLSKLGSFVVLGSTFFQVWCADESVRRGALLERVDSYTGARNRLQRSDLATRVARIGQQVGLGTVDLADLRQMASRAGKRDLAALLDRIAAQP